MEQQYKERINYLTSNMKFAEDTQARYQVYADVLSRSNETGPEVKAALKHAYEMVAFYEKDLNEKRTEIKILSRLLQEVA